MRSNSSQGHSRKRWLTASAALAVISFTSAPAQDWRSYNGGPDQQHYSPLTQVNRENVSRLTRAWSFDTGDAYPGSELECNPLVIDGVLYATTPKLNVIALNAGTGVLLWRFDPNGSRKVLGRLRSRGLNYWSSGAEARIFVAVRQYLYALDARTGRPVSSFGSDGRIDLREGLGRDPTTLSVTMSTPGVVWRDVLIVGSAVSELPPAAPGDIRAFDVRTGRLLWSFHTIPHPGEPGYDTWPPDAWRTIGGANSWAGLTLDEQRGIVFAPTGSPTFDFYGGDRKGDNLFSDTLIALDAKTGRRLWHLQTVRHDLWDRDLPAAPTLVTVRRGSRDIDAVAQVTKSGFVFVLDRTTGESLFPTEERRVAASDIPGEGTASAQMFPLKPEPFARQRLTDDVVTRRTPAATADVRARIARLRNDGPFVPGSREGTVIFPGFDGGAEWGGAAFDPVSRRLYVNANEMPWVLTMVERPRDAGSSGREVYQRECAACHGADRKGQPPQFPALTDLRGRYTETELFTLLMSGSGRMPSFARLDWSRLNSLADYLLNDRNTAVVATSSSNAAADSVPPFITDGFHKLLDPDGYPGIEPPWGTLSAIDLDTGDYAWKIPIGEYPELAKQGRKTTTGSENYGGPVVTASGLLFIGATVRDRKFRAFDANTGELLWQTTLEAGAIATPAVYETAGRQFVVIAVGGGREDGAEPHASYVAFALPIDERKSP